MEAKGNRGLVAAARYIFDPDQVSGQRFIYLGSKAHYGMMVKNLKEIKDAASSLAYYVSQAEWEFLEVCKATLKTRYDTLELERCGLTIEAPTRLLKLAASEHEKAVKDPIVIHENIKATQYYRYTFQMTARLIGTRLVHTNGLPGKLATVTVPSRSRDVMKDFSVDVFAIHAAREPGNVPFLMVKSRLKQQGRAKGVTFKGTAM